MLIEVLRSVTDALADNTIGVNVQLASVPLDAGDPVPTPVVLITDETRNLELALNKSPSNSGYPMLLVTINNTVELKGAVVGPVREGTVQVLVQYVTSGNVTQNLVRDAYYTVRAIEMCLNDFHSNTYASMRERNGIMLQECMSMTHQLVTTYESDQKVLSGINVTYLVRDAQL